MYVVVFEGQDGCSGELEAGANYAQAQVLARSIHAGKEPPKPHVCKAIEKLGLKVPFVRYKIKRRPGACTEARLAKPKKRRKAKPSRSAKYWPAR